MVGNVLRTCINLTPQLAVEDANALVDDALATFMHEMHSNVTMTLNRSPGSCVFGRGMFISVPFMADWYATIPIINKSLLILH